ncbi:efflux protein EncT [Cryptococcus deuterogattii 99/473]|uniref:Unplaced genomic scaffold supercont1.4, whole genome shotgun sequence n=1 Tax=Cryptococcus deuterogattii Ram5 TaxID=1296110 RepID=A0A0D0VBI0_9TREE|nr:efflux protein EncT [Cryptococcus deuterogattii LA55]KIR42150.1 efflux protein EncT [Cryptococcus deuterogattii Ram5]KIR90198.1 efflux protein EncT [Cryptococcus deuterogattii CBS 10090]KIY56045.1 efflux protein EncT [Cryptococcus deuterogattii 99/473]
MTIITDKSFPRTVTIQSTSNDSDPKKSSTDERSLPAESTLGKIETPNKSNVLASLGPGRKNLLLLCFCLSMFIDAAGVSATFLMTAPIANDLGVKMGDLAWILGTYSLAFASTLLFAGRIADLYPPHRVYTFGFIGIAVFYLIISFMTDQYAFFVLRAISGLLAVMTIPSSINMIVQMYPEPNEQAKKLALFGVAGALANTIALVLAGVFLLASWRWYFRFITIIIAPFSVLAWFLMPPTEAVAEDLPGAAKLKRMDIVGVLLLLACLVLFILGFTQATSKGWDSAIFIAPIIISVFLLAAFLVWEQYVPRGYSLLPHDIWSFPNIFPLIFQASAVFMWIACAQLRLATFFQENLHDSAIMAAVKLLPMGIIALIVGGLTQAVPQLIMRPKYVQPIASALCLAGSLLFAFSDGGPGDKYWKFLFPGQLIGTAGAMVVFVGMNTSIIQAFPLEFAGVGGSFANIIFQIGGVIGIAVQDGLVGTGADAATSWTGSKNSYFFTGAYIMLTGVVFLVWYRQKLMPKLDGPVAAV